MSINITGTVGMYLSRGLNAKKKLDSADPIVLYTAPSEATFNFSVINSILVSETTNSADTITVTITDTADSPVTFNVFDVKAVSGHTTVELLTNDLILQSGEILKVEAATADRLEVTASILEYAQWR
tara:strand:+ start:334 stop:714 length:381 start_codon:yes stop_codon:yes gene_type:complete